MKQRKGRGRHAADKGGDDERFYRKAEAPPCPGLRLAPACRPGLIGRDQRAGGRKGHLEARRHHAFRVQRHHGDHGEGETAQAQRGPVKQDGAEKDRRHDKGALGRDARAGDDEIARRGDKGGHCGRFLHRDAHGNRFDQGKAAQDDPIDQPADNPEMQARYGQQMRQPRPAQGLGILRRHETAVARHEGRGEPARARAGGLVHIGGELAAQAGELHPSAPFDPGWRTEHPAPTATHHIADPAKPAKPGRALEIIIGPHGGRGRRAQHAITAHEPAGRHFQAGHMGHADKTRGLFGREAGNRLYVEGEARAAAPAIDTDHPAFHEHRLGLCRDHRAVDHRRAQLGEAHAPRKAESNQR